MDKFNVNQNACIGCGACTAICPDVFSINDEGLAEADNNNINESNIDDAKDAMEGCPTSAIENKND